jgi:ABC-type nitrate/sulfonate/bicarbonate transport system substrate-binding protein
MKRRFFTLAPRLTWIGMLALIVFSCQGGPAGKLETITIGLPALEQNALIYVADQQGFFRENGLQVNIQDHDSGVTAIQGLSEGKVDLAVAAEFPVVRALIQKHPLSILASSDKFENDYLLGRKDRGIEKAPDLKGRRIGVMLGSINEFYLARFLELNGIALSEVTLVDLKPAQFVDAIAGGKVDALIAWQPYIDQVLETQPDLVLWPAQNDQAVYGLLVGREEWLASHGKTVERFLRALVQAERYSLSSTSQAREIVQERLGYDRTYVAKVWPQHQFSLALDFSMIIAMNDEAHWLIDQDPSAEKEIPNFLDFIYIDGLTKINPDAVNIIR